MEMTTIEYDNTIDTLIHIRRTIRSLPATTGTHPLSPTQLIIALGSEGVLTEKNVIRDSVQWYLTLLKHPYKLNSDLRFTLRRLQLSRYNELKNTPLSDYFMYLLMLKIPVLDVRLVPRYENKLDTEFEYVYTKHTAPGQPVSTYRSSWIGVPKDEYTISTNILHL